VHCRTNPNNLTLDRVVGGSLVINNLQKLGRRDLSASDGQTPSRREKKELRANGEHCRNAEPGRKQQPMTTLQTTKEPISISRTPQKVQAGTRTVRITARVRAAVEAMVWQGLKRNEAAQVVGMKDNSLYAAFRKADVRAFYLSECEVLRVSGRARRIHRLEGLVEQDENKMAAVQASRTLDGMGEDAQARPGGVFDPHVTIKIVNQIGAVPASTIEHEPSLKRDPYEAEPEYDREGHLIPRFRFDPYR
jgi:hypothetical protein